MSVYAVPNSNVMLPITTINPNGLVVNQLQLYYDLTRDQTSVLVSFGSGWGPCNSDSYGAGTDGYSQCFIGSISILMVHFKQLALSEVQQNFNNLRNRFSL